MKKFISFMLLFLSINGLTITPFSSVSIVGLVEDSWTTKTSMSQPRWNMGIAVVEGNIYAIGGIPATPGVYSDNVGTNERYDPKTDTWTTLKPMPTPREDFTIFAYQNKIYCIGGIIRVPDYGGMIFEGVDVTEVYDIATDSWSTKSSSFNIGGITKVVNGQIFIVSFNQLYKYDIATDSSTVKTIPGNPSYLISATVVVDDKILFIREQSGTGVLVDLVVQIYDPRTDKWSEGTTGAADAYGLVAGATAGTYAPKKVYVLGQDWDKLPGVITSESFWTVNHVYDPDSDTWTIATAPSVHVDLCQVVNVDDILYVIGGTVNEQYIPLGYHNATSAPKTSNSTPSELPYLEPFLIFPVITALVLTASIVVVSLLYFVFRKKDSLRGKIEAEKQ